MANLLIIFSLFKETANFLSTEIVNKPLNLSWSIVDLNLFFMRFSDINDLSAEHEVTGIATAIE